MMKRLGPTIDSIDVTDLLAVLALLGLAVGITTVASAGWAVVVVSALVLVYAVLASRTVTP